MPKLIWLTLPPKTLHKGHIRRWTIERVHERKDMHMPCSESERDRQFRNNSEMGRVGGRELREGYVRI